MIRGFRAHPNARSLEVLHETPPPVAATVGTLEQTNHSYITQHACDSVSIFYFPSPFLVSYFKMSTGDGRRVRDEDEFVNRGRPRHVDELNPLESSRRRSRSRSPPRDLVDPVPSRTPSLSLQEGKAAPSPDLWRQGYKHRTLRKTDPFLIPEWAVPLNPELSQVYLDCYKTEGVTLLNIYLSEKLQKENIVFFGRNPHDVIPTETLDHPSISRLHSAIVSTRDGLMLFDMGSSHGTFLNDKRITSGEGEPLFEYDIISFGSSTRFYKVKKAGLRRPAGEAAFLAKAVRQQQQQQQKPSSGSGSTSSSSSTGGPDQVRVRHLLVKHKDVRRPASWKSPSITRTKEEALALVEQFRARIASGEVSFEELAATESDCSSHTRGGDLGTFGRGKMQPPFEKASFGLAVGEMSGPVFSDSGVHIILRLA